MRISVASWGLASWIAFSSTGCAPAPDAPLDASSPNVRVSIPDSDAARVRIERVRGLGRRATGEPAFALSGGVDLVVNDGHIEASSTSDAHAEASLPSRADRPFRVRDTKKGLAIEARLVGARAVDAEVADGLVVYPGAHASGADVIHRITADGTEDYLVLDGPVDVIYEVKLGVGVAAVRQVGPDLEFLDESGDPRLRMDASFITDAEGVMHEVIANVSGCDVDTDAREPWGRPHRAPRSDTCSIALSWETLPYPALLDPAWNATGDMMVARSVHGMVTLPSGLVLAVGGINWFNGSGTSLYSCELFNPATGTWASTVSTGDLIWYPSCYLVSSNTKVFCWSLFGGSSMYDIATPGWTATGAMVASSRQEAAHAQLADGRIVFVGGSDDTAKLTAEIFDPAGNGGVGTYTATTSPPAVTRSQGGAVLLADNRVIVAGGYDSTNSVYALQTEIFNPTTGGFIPGTSLNDQKSNSVHGLRLPNNKVMLQGGGGLTEIYDPAGLGSWTVADITPPPSGGYAGLLGFVGANVPISIHPAGTYLFDTTMNTWSASVAHVPRSELGGSYLGAHAPIAGGRMLFSGGVDTTPESVGMKTTEIFNVAPAALGEPCTVNAECANNICASGICCSLACNAGCETCTAGMCNTAPMGHESTACGNYLCQGLATCPTTCSSDSQCVSTHYCASDNTCKVRNVQGTTCSATGSVTDCKVMGCRYCASAGGCVDGYCCNDACDGSCDECALNFGVCTNVTGSGTPSCGTYVCSGTASDCPTSCSSDGQCAATAFCDGSNLLCETKHTMGGTCDDTSDCQGGLTCVDDVCCTSTCGGQCQSCNRPGNLGNCVAVTGAPIGRAACNGSSAPCEGACNGINGMTCVYPTVSCRAADCASGMETLAATCDGNGSCPAALTNDCTPFACDTTECLTVCAADSDCESSHYCDGAGDCVSKEANGTACSADRECDSGTCEDDVCCNIACGGATKDCRACSVAAGAATDGKCATIARAKAHKCRPAVDACDVAEVCDGDSACPKDVQKSGCGSDAGSGAGTDAAAPPDADAAADTDAAAEPPTGSDKDAAAPTGTEPPPEDDLTDAGTPVGTHTRKSGGLCSASPSGRGDAPGVLFAAGLALLVALRRRRPTRALALGIALAAFASIPGIASAQPAQSHEEVARLHFQLGSALYEEGKFEQAAVEFQKAYEASQRPQLQYNIYVAYRDAQMLEPSLDALRAYIERAPESETALLRNRLASLEVQVAELRRLRAVEATAQTTPEPTHDTTSEPTPEPTTQAPSAAVNPTDSDSEGGSETKRIVGYVLIGLGGVGIVTFVGSLVAIGAADDDLNAHCGAKVGLPADQCENVPQVSSAESRIGTFRVVGWTSLVIGIAAAGAGTTLLLLDGSDDDATTASLGCDPVGCGAVVRGHF